MQRRTSCADKRQIAADTAVASQPRGAMGRSADGSAVRGGIRYGNASVSVGLRGGQQGGRWIAALFAGFVFTIGMGVTDTIDGRLLWRIGRRPEGQQLTRQFRRILGWLVVGISCGVAVFNIGKALAPQFEINDFAFSAAGFSLIALIAVMPLMWGLRQRALRRGASPN